MINISKKSLIIGGGLFTLVTGFLLFKFDSRTPAKRYPLVKVEKVKRQDLTEKLELIGSVVASESVTIKSRLDSQIEEVFIQDGARIKKDDKLFQLDDRYLKAQLKEAKANLESNNAEVTRAERQYNRDINLSKKGVVAKEQFDRSTQAYQAAKAAVTATEAKISSLVTQTSYADIRSPIEGVAGTINITQGNVVKANDTAALVVINKTDPVYIDVPLPQRYFWRYKANEKGLKASIKTPERQEIKIGEINSIQNALDIHSRTLTLRIKVDNSKDQLWPGMFVDVQLDIRKEKDAMVIPLKALLRTQKGDQVFKVVNKEVKLVPVNVLFTTAESAAVKADLNINDLIVIEGGFNLRQGDQVKVVEEGN